LKKPKEAKADVSLNSDSEPHLFEKKKKKTSKSISGSNACNLSQDAAHAKKSLLKNVKFPPISKEAPKLKPAGNKAQLLGDQEQLFSTHINAIKVTR